MGVAIKPRVARFFLAVTFNRNIPFESILELIAANFGTPDHSYGPVSFIWSDYYSEEMGEELDKYYAVFNAPFERENLSSIKNQTNRIEQEWTADGNRRINLDPGYLAKDKLVLASTKDFFHRIYIGEGIYGETTLHYRKGKFRHFSWTYPDYKDGAFLEFLAKPRAELVYELRRE